MSVRFLAEAGAGAAIGIVLVAYLIGSLPSAYLMGRLFVGRDIRSVGSGNVGGMNAFRNVTPMAGVLTALFDVVKGALAVCLARYLGAQYGAPAWISLAAGLAVVLGHNYMLYLGFRGGKGLGATVGLLLALWPVGILWTAAAIALGALVLRDTNAGTGIGVWLLPVFYWFGQHSTTWVIFGGVLALIISSKHLHDIRAYLAGRRQLV